MTRRWLVATLTACLCACAVAPVAVRSGDSLPAKLSDQEFWALIDDYSEANGYFQSDNLVSNEDTFQFVIPRLLQITKPGGVYLGVGPDQNFTYIAALKPKIVFITDIRRGNLDAHLMYKALFELSADRADFLSRLFSRKRPAGLGADSTAAALFAAFGAVESTQELYDQTWKAMIDLLTRQHGSALAAGDVSGIEHVFSSFSTIGPTLSYAMGGGGRGPMRYPSYQDLQLADDGQGHQRGYIASEENFKILKTIEHENRLVPLVGDFAGPKALRSVGKYLAEHGATVTAFYTSNVEQYLFQNGVWGDFARNVATLPQDDATTFIRSCFNMCASPVGSRSVSLLDSLPLLIKDFNEGRIMNYPQVLNHSAR
jgi:hypothetical protein